jgi:hypothetical protein
MYKRGTKSIYIFWSFQVGDADSQLLRMRTWERAGSQAYVRRYVPWGIKGRWIVGLVTLSFGALPPSTTGFSWSLSLAPVSTSLAYVHARSRFVRPRAPLLFPRCPCRRGEQEANGILPCGLSPSRMTCMLACALAGQATYHCPALPWPAMHAQPVHVSRSGRCMRMHTLRFTRIPWS